MLVHPELDACFAYRNPAVHAIQHAFQAMLDARSKPGPRSLHAAQARACVEVEA